MSTEALVGIIITVILGVAAFFIVTKKTFVKIKKGINIENNHESKISSSENIIGNIINDKSDEG